MSRLFGRVGTSAMKYQFELTVTSLHMSLPLTTPMCVKFTRGPRTAMTQPVSGVNGEYQWPVGKPPMQIVATMYYKKNKFQEKLSKLTVKQLLGKDLKSVGQAEIDLAEFCGEGEVTRQLTLKLQKCSDKKAILVCTLRSRWLKQLDGTSGGGGADDTASQLSGASSVDARSESEMPSTSRQDVANLNDLDGMDENDYEPSTSRRGAGEGYAVAAHSYAAGSHSRAGSDSMHALSVPSPGGTTLQPMSSPPSSARGGGGAGAPTLSYTVSTPNASSSGAVSPSGVSSDADLLRAQAAELEELRAKVETLSLSTAKSQALSTALQSSYDELEAEHLELASQHQELEAEHDRVVVKLRAEVRDAKAASETLASEHTTNVKQLELRLADQTSETDGLRARLTAATTAAETNTSSAAAAVGDATARLTEVFDGERANLERQLKDLRAELSQATARTEEATTRLASLEAKTAREEEERRQEVATVTAEVERLESELRECTTALQAAREESRHHEAAVVDAKRNEADVKEELASLQASFMAEMTRRETTTQENDDLDRQLQEARTAAKKIEMTHEAEVKTLKATWQSEREKLQAEVADARNKLDESVAAAAAATQAQIAAPTQTPTPDEDNDSPSSANQVAETAAAAAVGVDAVTQVVALQKKVDEYALRLASSEEDRVRLESEVASLDAALAKQKEDELSSLEERYEETLKWKTLIKEKDTAAEESARTQKDLAKEAKEARTTAERSAKDLREKSIALETSEAAVESLQTRATRAGEEQKRMKLLVDQGAVRIRELEAALLVEKDSRDVIDTEVRSLRDELDRATKKRDDLADEWEAEREQLKKARDDEAAQREVERTARASPRPSPMAAVTSPADQPLSPGTVAADAAVVAAELLHTQGLVLQRNAEMLELEAQVKELRARLRPLEDLEERHGNLLARQKESDALATKRAAEAARERVELEESLSLTREKLDRARAKLTERDERDREARTSAAHSATATDALQTDLTAANARIEELQEQLASKQSKVAEQQDKLNALTRTSESLTREHATTRDQLVAITAKHDTAAANLTQATTRLESEKAAHAEAVAKLERELAHLHSRRMIFDALEADAVAAVKRDRPTAAIVESLQKKIVFYEEQLQDADESMSLAKQSWLATSSVLAAQVEELERTVKQLTADLQTARDTNATDATRVQSLESRLKKSDKDKSKLSELMSRFEVELTQKKVELAASLDQLSTQEYENDKLRAQLSRQLKACEAHMQEINQTRDAAAEWQTTRARASASPPP